jgi:hypothetical protein
VATDTSGDSDRTDPAEEPVPKLPRGRGMRFSAPELFRIAMTLGFLVAVIALTKPCANAVSTFVMGFDGSGSGKGSGSAGSGSAAVDPYEHLTPNMSDDEVKAAIERAKAKNAGHPGVEGTAPGAVVPPRTPAGAPGSAATPRRTPAPPPTGTDGSAAPKPAESHLVLPNP